MKATNHLLDAQTWAVVREQATVLFKSRLLPQTIDSPEKAIAIILKGSELGIPPMLAFSHLNIIKGKPTISSELMLALIYKNLPGVAINFVRIDNLGCEIEACRPGSKLCSFKFTQEDAKSAQLLDKEVWKLYPRSMYRSRCISEMARSIFPDIIMGCSYTPEELGHSADIHDDPVVKINRPTFDPEKLSHVEALKESLKKRGISEEHHYTIKNLMAGKENSYIDEAIGIATDDK